MMKNILTPVSTTKKNMKMKTKKTTPTITNTTKWMRRSKLILYRNQPNLRSHLKPRKKKKYF